MKKPSRSLYLRVQYRTSVGHVLHAPTLGMRVYQTSTARDAGNCVLYHRIDIYATGAGDSYQVVGDVELHCDDAKMGADCRAGLY